MSMFSGKCDFADHIEMSGIDKVLKANIYVGKKRIKPKEYKDLIPYLAHIVTASSSTPEGDKCIRLSEYSYVDAEEEEILDWHLKELLRIYKRCQRAGIEFIVEDAVSKMFATDYNRELITELAKRVKEHGKKATIDGVHLKMQEIYRSNLVQEMLKHGVDPKEWGYDRFLKDGDVLSKS